MKRIILVLAVFAVFCFAGCATIEDEYVFKEKILIVSDPPGAKIEVNNEYLGDTPYKLQVNEYLPCRITICAYPPSAASGKYFLQKKTIEIYPDDITGGVFFPGRVYFDMSIGPCAQCRE